MTLEELKSKFDLNSCQAIDIAHAKYSKKEAILKIAETIDEAGVDVDGAYLEFVKHIDEKSLVAEVKYVPVYCVTAVARLSWKEKEEGQDPIDHQEFCKFNTIFYGHDDDPKDRINNLNITKIFDKKELKLDERPAEDPSILQIGTNNPLCDTSNLQNQVEIVMDAPISYGDYYDIDGVYLCSNDEIKRKVEKALSKTKSYKKLQKEQEKWSEIVKLEYRVVLVAIASIKVGKHTQLINCTNGTLDVIYEESKEITHQWKKAMWMSIPLIVIFAALAIVSFIFKMIYPDKILAVWSGFPKIIFGNIYDVIWVICFVVGVIFSLLAFPRRKGMVKRATKKKNMLIFCKRTSRVLLEVDCVLLLLIIFSIALKGLSLK